MAESICLVAAARMPALYPRVRLRLKTVNWTEVPRAVIDREAPIGLLDLRSFDGDSGLEVETLRPHPGVFLVRPGHPLTGRAAIGLADIMAFPMIFIGRSPQAVLAQFNAAREQARATASVHPVFPAIMHESPTVATVGIRHGDAVAAATLPIAMSALRSGEAVALRWRPPWVSVHPGIVRLRRRPLGAAERAYLDLLRAADREAETESLAWCAAAGLSADCA
jgi:DNA-binding transcriptional LysR family regulator